MKRDPVVPETFTPAWRPFAQLSLVEAAVVAAHFPAVSFDVHATCRPGQTSFAVAARDPDGKWHWAVFSQEGVRLDDGYESGLEDAQRVALEALLLWAHRCDGRRECQCPSTAGLQRSA